MRLVQSYETTVQDNDTNLAAHVFAIPRRSLPKTEIELVGSTSSRTPSEHEYLMGQLGLWSIRSITAEQLPAALAALVSHAPELWGPIEDTSFEASRTAAVDAVLAAPFDTRFSAADRDFAQAMASEPLIPFEESPLAALSLADIAKAGGVGVGAYIGIVVAGATPLLFLTVPAGMILCGAASGIGLGLERGLRARISRLIGRAAPRPNPAGGPVAPKPRRPRRGS